MAQCSGNVHSSIQNNSDENNGDDSENDQVRDVNIMLVSPQYNVNGCNASDLPYITCFGCIFYFKKKGLALLSLATKKMITWLDSIQVILNVILICLCGVVFIPLAAVTSGFQQNCLLFADIYVIGNKNQTVSLNLEKTVYGSKDDCNYATYINVAFAINCLIINWFTFHHIILDSKAVATSSEKSRTQKSSPSSFIILLIIYVTFLICILVSSAKISQGFAYLCDKIVQHYEGKELSCMEFESLQWIPENTTKFFTYFLISEIGTWLLTVFLTIQILVLSYCLYLSMKAVMSGQEIPHEKLIAEVEYSDKEPGYVNHGVEEDVMHHEDISAHGVNGNSMEQKCLASTNSNGTTTQALVHDYSDKEKSGDMLT